MATPALSARAQCYVATVVAAGTMVLAWSGWDLWHHPLGGGWILLAILTTISSAFPLRVPGIAASLSISEAFVFTSVLIYGPSAATVTVSIDGLILSLGARSRKWHRAVFNSTQPALSLWIAAQVFSILVPEFDVQGSWPHVTRLVACMVLLTATYFLLNSLLNAIAVGLEAGKSILAVWWEFRWASLNYAAGVSLAALLTQRSGQLNYVALALLAPLLSAFYLTLREWVARSEEARAHLDRLNRLYLSTIETLAMAIDAKDQITHGHIRRVQLLAVGLARRLGIDDDTSIKAIEAAALLHDMGKLAIPEHILNKPGKLSPAEFEQMKQHASIGADILSRIDFPYPVVPIVRHHHEFWNGGGYPDGISGDTIPIGARILSVVDCYDALVSDRPYRRALTDEQALAILFERRGTMYDPTVVDTFARVYREIAPTLQELAAVEHLGDMKIEGPRSSRTEGLRAAPSGAELSDSTLARTFHALADVQRSRDVTAAVADYLITSTPAATCAFYFYDVETDRLVLKHAVGTNSERIEGLEIPVGENLSGWVAANRRTILNSDAALDLASIAGLLERALHSTLSTPLMADTSMVGVLTLYAEPANAFRERDQRLVENIAPTLSQLIFGVLALERVQAATANAVERHPVMLDRAS